jgi:hypothetical protein
MIPCPFCGYELNVDPNDGEGETTCHTCWNEVYLTLDDLYDLDSEDYDDQK